MDEPELTPKQRDIARMRVEYNSTVFWRNCALFMCVFNFLSLSSALRRPDGDAFSPIFHWVLFMLLAWDFNRLRVRAKDEYSKIIARTIDEG